jgi:hypothetical protein
MKALLALAVLIASAVPAMACSCARGPNLPKPPFIVEARVVTVTPYRGGVRAELEVIRTESGKVARRIHVLTPPHSAACGVEFRQGEIRRLGFGTFEGQYSANLCQQIAIEPPRR